MAKVRGPLMSQDASGTFGHNMVFRGGLKGSHVYRLGAIDTMNRDPPSAAQQIVRSNYKDAREIWAQAPDSFKKEWEAIASARFPPITGWNLFLSMIYRNRYGADAGASWDDGEAIWLDEIPSFWDL